MSRFRYVQPTNEETFEELCLVLLRETRPRLERYAHRGEEQHGVDLLDMSGDTPLFAAQCKHHDPNKSLQAAELEAEVKKARLFPVRIGEYVFLTTAKKTGATQLKVRELNEEHRRDALFSINLMTWEEMESLIDNSPAAQALLGYQPGAAVGEAIEAAIQPLHAALVEHATASRCGDLDDAKARLDAGEPQAAIVFVQRARRRWSDLTPPQRARACGLEADARLRLGEPNLAARALLEARTHAPDDEKTIVNEIAARRVLGEIDTARDLARAARSRFPFSADAQGHSISLAATTAEALAIVAEIPSAISDAPDVLCAIAERVDLGEYATLAALRVTAVAPDDAQAWYALGNLLLEREIGKVVGCAPEPTSIEALEQARVAFRKVTELAEKRGDKHNHVAGLLRRMVASALLHDDVELQREGALAMQLAPENPHVLIAGGRAAIDRGDADAAVSILRRAATFARTSDARFFLGAALWNRNATGDHAEAAVLLAGVARNTQGPRDLAAEISVEAFLHGADHAKAIALLDDIAATLDPVLIATLRARVASATGDHDAAHRHGDLALAGVSSTATAATRLKLAKVLGSQGRYSDALAVIEPIASPAGDQDAGRLLVECASRLGRHAVILAYCAAARRHGIDDDYLLGHELRLLDRYDPLRALEILREVLARDPGKHAARVHLMMLAVRLGRLDEVREHADRLPHVTDVEPDEGAAVVALLLELERGRDALGFAYELLRLHFDDHRAHRAFRDAVMLVDREDKPPEAPEEVAPGVAVCVAEDGQRERWYVIEDSPNKAPHVENEIRPDDGLAKLLLGKRVGDEVLLSDGPGIRRAARVRDIVTKHVFRARDVWQEWQLRFPEQQEMWMVRVGPEEEPDFKELFSMLEHRRGQIERVEEFYRTHPIPLAALAKLLNENEIRALAHVAGHESLRMRCCRGTLDELQLAVSSLTAAGEVVLELSAIGTLLMADDLEALELLGKPLLVSHSTLLAVRALAEEAKRGVDAKGTLGATREGPRLEVASDAFKESRVAFFQRVVKWFEAHATVVGALELAEQDPALRKELGELIGDAALESAAIATRPNRLLLTDDGVLALVVREKLGVRTVWTQATTSWMVSKGRLDAERHARLSARLIGWGYDFTSASQATMRAAGRLAEWHTDAAPLRRVLDYLALPSVALPDALRLGAMLAREGYTDIVLPDQRGALFVAVLDALAKRRDADERAFRTISGMLAPVFGINVVGHADARRTFDAWRAARAQRVT